MARWLRWMALLGCLIAGQAVATCNSTFLNPITGINWQCAFPMNLGGVVSFGVNEDNSVSDSNVDFPVCSCLLQGGATLVGVNVAFWEPSRLIETVKDPFCFPSLGIGMPSLKGGTLLGANTSGSGKDATTVQAHYYVYPVWAMLKMFLDVPCLAGNRVDGGGQDLDLAMITEVLPNWNNDLLAFLLNPEALLFANPAAMVSCIADMAAATADAPLNELFWCMGGWPGVYPAAGKIGTDHIVEANAVAAGRLIYQIGRLGGLLDHGINACGSIRTVYWRKRNYRFHFAQPVRGGQCLHFGTPTPLWERFKNTPVKGDNFSMVLFRRVKCCLGY